MIRRKIREARWRPAVVWWPVCLWFLIGMGLTAHANNDAVRFAENANLALRRTVHALLRANGDSASAIPPVQQINASTFSVRMERMFDYDKLPRLLQQSLDQQHITQSYNVTVLDCDHGQVQLGYNYSDLKGDSGVPCQGRIREPGCYVLRVHFMPDAAPIPRSGNAWLITSLTSALAGLGFIVWKRVRRKKTNVVTTVPLPDNKLHFAHSWLDMPNQTLFDGRQSHSLTFREAKLLHLFANHPNQVLERDAILQAVWEDEGVTVGRSIDVFVSRLRKLLAADAGVKITAIHGIGYKMEVHS